ncbi:MAG: glycerol kinase GlpK [Gemmatimonadetes bacterium]|nr:glycerol kinase GlpK [Gemmatimonadota bacterium]
MPRVLAIDQGTTGSTCLVIDEGGRIVGRAYSEFAQHYPRPGWVEHDADEIWRVTLRVAREALAAAGVAQGKPEPATPVAAIGITNQRETVVLWDRKSGAPLHPAIVWQDRRTASRCRELRDAGREAWVRRRTGLVLDPYFSATKLEWLLAHVPGARARAERGELAAGTIDSWLIWKLTGGRAHATDPSNASRTLLFDIDRHDWDDELLSLFGVPRALLPAVQPSSGIFGETDPALFGAPIPIAGVAGDQQAALFGQGCFEAGLAKNTYGTGAFLLLNTGGRRIESSRGLLTTVACGPRGEPVYALEGSIFIAGAAVQWLRDALGIITSAAETEALARQLSSNDGVYFVPAFVGLGAPHWDAEARGTIVGLTRGSGRAHVARAALEAMAYATRDVLDAMAADSGFPATELAVDGGAAQNDWLMQFQADVLGIPVRRPALVETTALGAAGLAGLATGIWSNADAFRHSGAGPTRFTPNLDAGAREALLSGWRRAVAAARTWAGGAGRAH